MQHLVRVAVEENPDLVVMLPRRRITFGASASYAWLLLDQSSYHVTGVTEDGLHGAAIWGAMLKDWVKNAAKDEPSPIDMQSGAIQYFAAYFQGVEFDDQGHAYAMKVAMAFLENLDAITDTTTGGVVAGKLGFKKEQFMAGFLDGLAYFESEPTFWE